MNEELRKFALRLKVIEIIGHYAEARRQIHVLRTWKRILISPN